MIDFRQYKVFIFDFDETMYYSSTIKATYLNYLRRVLNDLTNFSEEDIEAKLEQYGFKGDGSTRVSFGKNCEKFGITKQQWNNYRIDNFFEIDYQNAIIADNAVYTTLAQIGKLFIVSNEIKENIILKAQKLGIDLTPFKKIYAPSKADVLNYDSSKKIVYETILNNEGISPQSAIVFGDRYLVDISPMEELGGKGVLIKRADELNKILLFNKEYKNDERYAVSCFNGGKGY